MARLSINSPGGVGPHHNTHEPLGTDIVAGHAQDANTQAGHAGWHGSVAADAAHHGNTQAGHNAWHGSVATVDHHSPANDHANTQGGHNAWHGTVATVDHHSPANDHANTQAGHNAWHGSVTADAAHHGRTEAKEGNLSGGTVSVTWTTAFGSTPIVVATAQASNPVDRGGNCTARSTTGASINANLGDGSAVGCIAQVAT